MKNVYIERNVGYSEHFDVYCLLNVARPGFSLAVYRQGSAPGDFHPLVLPSSRPCKVKTVPSCVTKDDTKRNMRLDRFASILALPAGLRLACAERYQVPGENYAPDDAVYDSGLNEVDQQVLGVPCPDYTSYATARQ